jgi:hypothetical protein
VQGASQRDRETGRSRRQNTQCDLGRGPVP